MLNLKNILIDFHYRKEKVVLPMLLFVLNLLGFFMSTGAAVTYLVLIGLKHKTIPQLIKN